MAGYYPNNYNPYYTGTPNMNQTVQTQSQPMNLMNSFTAVLVDSEASARAYPVAAGNTVVLIDFNSGHFWFKSTEATGMPQQLRTFEFKEVTQQPVQQVQGVSREEFNALNDKIDKLIAELGGK